MEYRDAIKNAYRQTGDNSFPRTDWFIRHLYQPMQFFTPPYETVDSLESKAGSYV